MQSLRILEWNVNDFDHNGRTPLHLACSEGRLEAVEYLINSGADIDVIDSKGNDPLKDAVR